MLTQDEAVSYALSQCGQRILSPSDLAYDDRVVKRDLFLPAVREYQRYRPVRSDRDIDIPFEGYVLPKEVLKVVALFPVAPYFMATLLRPNEGGLPPRMYEDQWYIQDNRLYAASGAYRMRYLKAFTVTQDLPTHEAYVPYEGEDPVSFRLRGLPVAGTLKLFESLSETGRSASEDENGEIAGDLGEGTIDASTGEVSFTVSGAMPGTVYARFRARNPAVLEIDYDDEMFFDLFAPRLLEALASVRINLRIDGVAFDLNQDDLLQRARERRDRFQERLQGDQKWWAWL